MGWGQDLINLYNDPYIPVLGKRDEWALGASARVVWKDIWEEHLGSQADAVLLRGEASWNDQRQMVMYRNGYAEETYFTFSFSPLPADEGGIGGLFCTCTEDTRKVLGERRLVALRHLALATSDARTEDEAVAIAARTLLEHDDDVSFSLIYLTADDGDTARLAGDTGEFEDVSWASPVISLAPDREEPLSPDHWPLWRAAAEGMQVLRDLDVTHQLPGGRWPEPATTVAVVPLARAGHNTARGFIVVGASPRLPFDEHYQSFFELLARGTADALSNARAYEEEKKRAEALAELDRAKTAFFSNVSHEFRTPLTLLLGPAEDMLAMKQGLLPSEATEQVRVIHRNALRLQRLVNTLLDFSRIEAGRAQASYVATDLAGLTADLASVFRSTMERAGLTFTVDCPALPWPVWVDRGMWEKVVFNLLSNAFKFTLSGQVTISLRAEERREEAKPSHDGKSPDASPSCAPSVVLSVRDTGVGIAAHELPNVFKRFHRIESGAGRTHEGTGIGLALAYELVKLHGGAMEVESDPGCGTIFHVHVPCGTSHLPADRLGSESVQPSTAAGGEAFIEAALTWLPEDVRAAARTDRAEPGAAGALDRPRVLVAEDNADMRAYVHRLLQSSYRVESVPHGAAALAAARRHPPDLILSDVMMPELNGFELVQQVRADEQLRTTPIILLSARSGDEARVEGISQGADDYIVKPFSPRELLARIATHLHLAHIRHAASDEVRRSGDALRASEGRLREANESLSQRLAELQRLNEAAGKSRRAALNLMQDTIQSRQASERLNAELREGEERYRTLVSVITDVPWVADAAGAFTKPQSAWEAYTGQPWTEHQGFGWAGALHPDDRAAIIETWKQACAAKTFYESHGRVWHAATQRYRYFVVRAIPLLHSDGSVREWVGSCTDVHDRALQEDTLRRLNDELEQRVSERTHALRQSEDRLRALTTELNLAEQRERKRLADDLHDYLAQLLVVCRMTLGQAKRTTLPPRAEDLVKETDDTLGKALTYCRTLMAELCPPVLRQQGLSAGLTWLAGHMQRHEMKVTVDVSDRLDLRLPEDQVVLLFQSVRELLINVAKHGAVKQATVSMTYEAGTLRIVVRDDNGFDLAAAAMGMTSPLSSKFGLFSIRERMKALGGEFDIQSTPGQGTVATLSLPIQGRRAPKLSDEHEETPPTLIPPASVSTASHPPTIRVLLVDDHTVIRQGLRTILTAYSHLEVVGEAINGEEAVALVQQLTPDVVVMDINMPHMDGIEATRRIKSYRPETIVIGLSINQSAYMEHKMRAAGASAYLTKESATDALYQAIEEAMSYKQHVADRQHV